MRVVPFENQAEVNGCQVAKAPKNRDPCCRGKNSNTHILVSKFEQLGSNYANTVTAFTLKWIGNSFAYLMFLWSIRYDGSAVAQ